MTDQRCVIADCAIPKRHGEDCTDREECGGCLVALAAVGYLCHHHHRRLERAIAELPSLYTALGSALVAPDSHGERVGGTRMPGLALNAAVVDARDRLRGEAESLARMVADERGFTPPSSDLFRVSAFLLASLEWLAHHPAVDELYGELLGDKGVVTVGRWLAYPSGRRRFDVTERTGRACPAMVDHGDGEIQPCGGHLRAVLTGAGWAQDEGRLVCVECGAERPITLLGLADLSGAA